MDQTQSTTDERRAEDQDTAIEQAFVAGTLPEEDRRTQEEQDADEAKIAAAIPADGVLVSPTHDGVTLAEGLYHPEGGPLHLVTDETQQAGTVTLPPDPALPFPHDLATPHALDNQPVGTQIVKDSAATISLAGPGGTTGVSIADGDALHHLPVGAQILVGEPGTPTAVMVRLPETPDHGAVASFGHRLHEAMAGLWRWLAAGTGTE